MGAESAAVLSVKVVTKTKVYEVKKNEREPSVDFAYSSRDSVAVTYFHVVPYPGALRACLEVGECRDYTAQSPLREMAGSWAERDLEEMAEKVKKGNLDDPIEKISVCHSQKGSQSCRKVVDRKEAFRALDGMLRLLVSYKGSGDKTVPGID